MRLQQLLLHFHYALHVYRYSMRDSNHYRMMMEHDFHMTNGVMSDEVRVQFELLAANLYEMQFH